MKKKLKMSPEGRKCEFPGCGRALSIYNHATCCRVHQAQVQANETPKPYRHFSDK